MNLKTDFRAAARRVVSVAAVALAGASGAHAAGAAAVDVADVVTTIGAQLTPIGLVGTAVMGVVVAVKAYRWVRAAMA